MMLRKYYHQYNKNRTMKKHIIATREHGPNFEAVADVYKDAAKSQCSDCAIAMAQARNNKRALARCHVVSQSAQGRLERDAGPPFLLKAYLKQVSQ